MHFYRYRPLILVQLAVVLVCATVLFNVAPVSVHAATTMQSFEVSGWIPYWRVATGTADVMPHLSQMTEINPFGFTVKTNGQLYDAAGLESATSSNYAYWNTLITAAHQNHVRVIPTVMWSDTASIHAVLSNPALRAAHEDAIVSMVKQYGFDGVDIDYEGKLAEDKANYAVFLKELYAKMGTKWVMCTIEARTPVADRYYGTTAPADATQYANDLTAINKYCDRVKLMTYDQDFVDLTLNAANKGALYAPIADPAWITRVVNLMSQSIKRSKIELGVATYGYIYQVIPTTDGTGFTYDLLEAFNPTYATQLAASLNITPSRNAAGELSFSYVPPELSVHGLPTQAELASYAPVNTPTALLASVGAITYAKASSAQAPFYLLWWSDSKAIAEKVALAKKLGLRGVAVFKIDGGEDQAMWTSLKKH